MRILKNLGLMAALLLALCVWGRGQQADVVENKDFEVLKNLEIFTTAYKNLELSYVDGVNPGELIKKALDAMIF